ncbi:MAG: translocation/assembly module TamB domain-containing protein [Spirochaetaceae bacterium]
MNGNPAPHRIHLPELLVIAGLVLLTALLFGPVQLFFTARMEELKQEVIADLEERAGRSISYRSISPSLLRAVEVRGLVINGSADERSSLVEIDRLRIFYRPLRLLFGPSDDAAAEIRIEDTDFYVDGRRDEDVIRLIRRMTADADRDDSPVFELSGRNVGVTYRDTNALYEVDDIFFQSTITGEEVRLDWESTVSARFGETDAAVNEVSGRVRLQGSLQPETNEAHLRVALPYVATPTFRVRNQSFDVTYDDSGAAVHKLQNNDPIDLTVKSDPDFEEVQVDLLAERFVPQDILSLRGPPAAFNPWLLGEMSGEAGLSYSPRTGAVAYSADLSGRTNNRELPEQVSLGIRVTGDERTAEIDELSVQPEQGELRFSGRVALPDLVPSGAVSLVGFSYGPVSSPLSGVLRVSGTDSRGITATSSRLSYGGVAMHDVEVSAAPFGEGAVYDAALSFDEDGESALTVSGSVNEQQDISATMKLVRVPALGVYDVAGQFSELPDEPRQALESVVLDASGELASAGDNFRLEASYVSAQDLDDPSRFVSFGLSRTSDRLEVRHLRAGLAGRQLSGGLSAQPESGGRIAFESDLSVNGREYQLDGIYRRGRRVDVNVSEGLDAQVYFNRSGEVVFAVQAEEVPLPSEGPDRTLSLRAGGSYYSFAQWTARIEELSVTNPAGAGSALSLAAEAGPDGGTISRFAYRDGVSRLKGEGSIEFADGAPPRLTLAAGTAEGDERYELSLVYEDRDLNGTVAVNRSPLRRINAEPIRGSMDATVDLESLVSDPRITVQFETRDATFNADSISARGTMRVSERALVLNRVNLRYLTRTLTDARGTLDLETGEATLSASVENQETDRDSRVKALVRAEFDESALPLSVGEVSATPFDAVVRLSGIDFPEGGEDPWELRVDRAPDELTVAGGPDDSIAARIATGGEFRLEVTDPLPTRFLAAGVLTGGEIEANVTNIFLDIGELRAPVEGETVSLTGGRFSGAIRVVGPVNDPDFFGTLEADDVESTVDFIAEGIGPANTFVVFQEKIIEINRFRVPVGRGEGVVGGTVILNRWAPEEYRLRIEIPDEPGVRVSYNFGGLFVDGYGRGELKIQGTSGNTDISGNILVDQTSLTLAEQVERPERSRRRVTTVDLRFETVGPTEFLWPNQEFPVLRALAERGESIRLTVASDTGSFSLRGRMNVQAGEIYYFDRSFYIREGHIVFDEDEEEFDPRLAVRAEIREIAAEGPVRVFLIVDEERLSSFTPRFESSPPLSDTELIALLGGNFLDQEGRDDIDFSQAVLLTSDLVTQFGVINRFERSVRDALGLDLFSVRTQLFQNLLLGSLPQPEYPLDNTSPSLGQYFENTAVFLGKYLGPELFMELLFSMRSRSPFEPLPEGEGPVEFESELGLEWQTPLFLLQWRFFPSDPETLFVTDNQIEFSWEFSY